MHILIGDTRDTYNLTQLPKLGWGRMCMTMTPKPFPHERYGVDNGAFPPWKDAGYPIGLTQDEWAILFDYEDFERRLATALTIPADPYMAVCPDIPGGGHESLEWSLNALKDLPRHWPWYLAVQDGMKPADLEDCLHLFAGVFLGGSDKFKSQALLWCKFAHAHQKKFHYGRAGTLRKLKHAFMVGADSCDSSFPLWTRDRFRKFVAAVGGLNSQFAFDC